ncbi:MAG TPA: FAD-linked oxidase C-terminal domain-containing protein, partial [Lacibacter sp.]|nr:FAD-linked oxidase C-terminal domain-containing protein [Lacibacter sp.]
LSAFEGMWHEFYECMVTRASGVRAPLAGRHPFYVLLEAHGSDPSDGQRFEPFLGRMLEQGVVADAAVAQSTVQVRAFWAVRDAVAEYATMVGPMVSFDVGLVTGRMHAVVETLRREVAARWPGAVAHFYGHIGDGNLHVRIRKEGIPNSYGHPGMNQILRALFGLVHGLGGTISGEHGIGLIQKGYMDIVMQPIHFELMRGIKKAFDPHHILNPGKIFD